MRACCMTALSHLTRPGLDQGTAGGHRRLCSTEAKWGSGNGRTVQYTLCSRRMRLTPTGQYSNICQVETGRCWVGGISPTSRK